MRIALFHNAPSGGAKRAIFEWVRRFAAAGHAVDVFSLSTADHAFCDVRPYARRHVVVDFAPRRLFESPFGRMNQWQRWRDLRRLDRIGVRLAADVDAGDYDVVSSHTCMGSVVPALLQYLRTPAVHYLHEPVQDLLAPGRSGEQSGWRPRLDAVDPMRSLYRLRLAALQARGIRRPHTILANSAYTRRRMWVRFGVDTPVSPCGVDTDVFRPMKECGKGIDVLSVGELSARKGFPFIVEALGRIPAARRPGLRLVCNVVQEPERRRVEALAAQHDVGLTIRTALDAAALAVEYNRARLFVYAPIEEPLGLAPLESMACGVPVVGVDEGGVSETVAPGRSGLLVPRHVEAMAAAVRGLLEQPGELERLGASARAYVEQHWTWDVSFRSLERHLSQAAAR